MHEDKDVFIMLHIWFLKLFSLHGSNVDSKGGQPGSGGPLPQSGAALLALQSSPIWKNHQ